MTKFQKTEHYEASGVPLLKPVLKKWIAVLRRYIQMSDDYPWGHRERPLIGLLAAAAWKAGGVALEEWSVDKHKGLRKDKSKGRCDLFIHLGKQSFNIEAKHFWSTATVKRPRNAVEKKLNEAVEEAKRLRTPQKANLGILFTAPFYPPGKQTNISSHIATWLEGIYKIPHAAIAWFFPDMDKLKRHRTNNVVPGIVAIVRAVK